MKRAIKRLAVKPNLTLIDGNFAPSGLKNCKTVINGDEKIKVISAASIIAKVFRDKLMIKLAKEFSDYAWESNFGYGTKAHLEGLKNLASLLTTEKVLNLYTRYCLTKNLEHKKIHFKFKKRLTTDSI